MRCCRKMPDGTPCPGEGIAQPVLLIYAPKKYGNCSPIKAALGLAVCQKHERSARVEDFVSDDGWKQIENEFAAVGRVLPDRSRTQLAFQPYADLEALMKVARERGAPIATLGKRRQG